MARFSDRCTRPQRRGYISRGALVSRPTALCYLIYQFLRNSFSSSYAMFMKNVLSLLAFASMASVALAADPLALPTP